MSNQCSNLFNCRSFNLFPPFYTPLKPYATILRPVFPFHGNFILIGRRSGNRSSLPPPLAAESSSDVVLVATKEHHDGSLIFQFGDPSEVLKIAEVVEEIESKAELEGNAVTVLLDGDQESQVVEKTIEGESGSDIASLTEVADEILNAEIDSDIAKRETNVTSDLRDHHEELVERLLHISEEEVLSSQFDVKVDESLEGVESMLGETECLTKLDEDENLEPTISLLDLKETISNDDDGVDETEDQLISVKPDSMQASDIEIMDAKQPYSENELQKVETEDENLLHPTTMHITDVELNDTANDDVNEELQDMNIKGVTLIDEMQPSDPSGAEPIDEVSQLESVDLKVETTMEASSTEAMDVKENEFQEVSMNKSNENDVAYVMPLSFVKEEEPILEDEFQPIPDELQATMQVLDMNDTTVQNLEDETLQANNETEDSSVSGMLETMEAGLMDVTQTDKLAKVELEESDVTDLPPQATMYISDADSMDAKNEDMEEGLQDMNIIDEMPPSDDDVSQLQLADVKLEATMEASTTKEMDVKDQTVEDELQQVSNDNRDTEEAEVACLSEEVSQLKLLHLELNLTMQVSTIELEITVVQNLDDGALQVINETKDFSETMQEVETEESDEKDLIYISEIKDTEAVNEDVEEGLQDMNTNENTLIDLTEDAVSELQSVDFEPTIQDSDFEVEDSKDQSLDDVILQIIEEDAGESYIKDVEQSLHQLEAQLVQDEGVNLNHNILEQSAEIDAVGSSVLLEQDGNGSQLEAENFEGNISSSEYPEALEVTPILLATEAKVEREDTYLTDYFLSSGAALLEHPFEALTGGDDAYFVSSSKWLGVANGVSQWSFEGTDPGVYAQELMRTCEEIVSNTSNVPLTNPVDLLCRGVKETNMSGSSNILIANFDGQALHVANIGDTGFLIIRHGAVYKKSSPLIHEFHFSLQVEDRDDPLQLVEEHVVELDEGDVIVSATDGLFDNLYKPEIAMVVSQSLQAGMKPEEVANVLATRAQEVGRSAFVRSPFSDAAQAAGYTGYIGGKPDNVAVIVSLVEKRSNLLP